MSLGPRTSLFSSENTGPRVRDSCDNSHSHRNRVRAIRWKDKHIILVTRLCPAASWTLAYVFARMIVIPLWGLGLFSGPKHEHFIHRFLRLASSNRIILSGFRLHGGPHAVRLGA